MKSTKANKRQNAIVEMLNSGRTIPVEEFCNTFQCSASTIRNDLNYLAEQNLITRVFGGAKSKSVSTENSLESKNTYRKNLEIAKYVLQNLIKPQSTIILDSGDICLEIANLLAQNNVPLSVLTFSLPIINILSNASEINLYAFGGFYNQKRKAFFDDYIQQHVEFLHADIYFMIASSVSPEAGFTISCQDVPITERSLMNIATKTIALCDSENLSKSTYRVISDFTEIDTMVTDSYADSDHVSKLKEAGLNVLVADKLSL